MVIPPIGQGIKEYSLGFFRFFGLFIAGIVMGVVIAIIVTIFLTGVNLKNEPDGENKFKRVFTLTLNVILIPGIMTGIAILFLIILKVRFDSPVELIILSSIFATGLVASGAAKDGIIFLVCYAIVIFYVLISSAINAACKYSSQK